MGDTLVRSAVLAILAKFGQNGMTLQEIIDKDSEIFNSDLEHMAAEQGIAIFMEDKIEQRDGKYFLKQGAASIDWAESTIQRALEEGTAQSYNPRLVVKVWGESIVLRAFGLVETDDPRLPDQKAKDGSFFVEVKTSAYNNGGVIKRKQLTRFDEEINARRFYAFVYHSITENMGRTYPNEERLYAALTLRSLYLFPLSIVAAHFEVSKKKPYPGGDEFVQLNERQAEDIFMGDHETWYELGILSMGYCRAKLHEKIGLITTGGMLETTLAKAFRPEVIESACRSPADEG